MPTYVNIVIPPLPERYTYRVPEELLPFIDVGVQVEVSFGRRQAAGFVVERTEDPAGELTFPFTIKNIEPREIPVESFLPEQLPFFQRIADYYGDSLSNVIDLAVPSAAEMKIRRTITLVPNDAPLRGKREVEAIELLRSPTPPSYFELSRRIPGVLQTLKSLESKGYLSIREEELLDLPFSDEAAPAWAKSAVDLNETQQVAVQKIVQASNTKTFEPYLLHGITGSGKTEVYIEAAREVLAAGRGVIIMVPEIALTPQLVDRFRARLGGNLGVLHSALAKRARWASWRALLEGRTQVALGARSALFAPVKNLGLIIVDEEHDGSYKQGEGIRYHARDLSVLMAKQCSCPVVLGTATPSLETFHAATTKRYHYLSLPTRHGTSTPLDIRLVDLNRVKPWEMASKHISGDLHAALAQTLERGEQAFLLYNRRGFASYLQCDVCAEAIKCENCSVTMTLHKAQNSLVCHYCGLTTGIPQFCPHCSQTFPAEQLAKGEKPPELAERGAGTERIFDEVKELFPSAAIERLDRDSASDHAQYRGMLDRFRAGTTQVIVGTQMIAKGHDIPNVTLVGVTDCDVGLHLPDFRSSERVFQLLTQAAGRAGRGEKPGIVVLQTRLPNHASLIKTVAQDYQGFAKLELENRRALTYPPFTRMLRIVVAAQDKDLPPQILAHFKQHLLAMKEAQSLEFTVLGPAAAPLQKLKTLWRAHMMIKSAKPTIINTLVRSLRAIDLKTDKARVIFDVDPHEML